MEAHSTIHHSATEGTSDVEIWQKLKKSDSQALKLIYNQHIKILYMYGGKFSKDKEVIEDCIQELFMTIWERRFIIGDTDAIRPYLLTSLRRRMIRVTSKNHIKIDRNFEIEKYDFNIEFGSEEKLINSEDNAELINKLSNELNKLTKKQQEVIYLKYHCGLSYEEIADVMTINYQSARNLMHKSLLLLRKQFSQLLLILSLLI
ncbi:sigma-70 family RNA polymerase sigma factor [Reichenbachiella sp. MALMAid0571]|uniref:RNA polymerase sigma factor n=1 Tax=Reichenbachiella sp. MALMAid0571 TaxID=3143939 RepID=UPI0032DE66D3